MKKIRSLFICLLTLCLIPLHAEIREVASLQEVQNYLTKNSLLFCELDEIFLQSDIIATKPAFYTALQEELIQEGYHPEQVVNKTYPIYYESILKAPFKESSSEVVAFLQSLKKKHIPCIPLTHRGPRLAYKTQDQLRELGLAFSQDPALLQNKVLEPELAHLYEGSIYVHPICSKSGYLLQFLKEMNIENKLVVCLDHKLLHLVEMEKILAEQNIPFLGLYLKDKEEKLSSEQLSIGKLQVQYLNQILPDSIGKLLVQKRTQEHAH